jgi:molybdopterin synthase catalytic subunit
MIEWIDITWDKLDVAAAMAFVEPQKGDFVGGIDVFLGVTRPEKKSEQETLIALNYEAYEDMALEKMKMIAKQAGEGWPVLRLAMFHRLGRVMVGEPSVVIAVATPHREAAFEACKWLIDTLKAQVPIWKKEEWSDGPATWVEGSEVKTRGQGDKETRGGD